MFMPEISNRMVFVNGKHPSSHKAFEMEETPNFDVLTCSKSSDLGQEQLNEIEQKAQAKGTRKRQNGG